MHELRLEELAADHRGAIKIGPFGSALPRSAMVAKGVKLYGQENLIARDWKVGDRRVSPETFRSLRSCELQSGDVVIGMMGSLGHCEIYTDVAEPGLMDSHLLRIQVDRQRVLPEYVRLLLLSDQSARQIERLSHGTIMAGLSSKVVRLIRLPIPPLAEQRRITEVFDAIDEAIRGTERVVGKARLARVGVLGELLWSADDGKRSPLVTFADVAGGLALSENRPVPDAVELPYLRVANVQDGFVDTSSMRTIRVSRSEVERFRLRVGDVLMNEGGDYDKLGRGAVWDGRIEPCLHQNHVFRVRCDVGRLAPEFLALFCQSYEGRRYFINNSKQTTNLASINKTQIGLLPLPVLSLERQREIVETVWAVDERVRSEQAAAQKLRSLRSGLAADLLSGRVRVGAVG